uniref:Uncharacterized protein n=1 Tax=Arundo donax TaxID=35708 RepID=A0A0A9H3J9_ARUDO
MRVSHEHFQRSFFSGASRIMSH